MKRLLLALLFMLLVVSAQAQSNDLLATAAQAEIAYQNADYAAAADLYTTLIEAGWQNSTLFFNLGNTYYHQGDWGRALLNYRLAQRITPRDADLNHNLALVRAQRVEIQGDEVDLIAGLAEWSTGLVTLPELQCLALLLWFGWFGRLSVAVIRPAWGRRLRVSLAISGGVVLLTLVLLGSRLWMLANRPAGVVVKDVVSVMSGPGADYLDLFALHSAAELHLIDARAGWLRFSLPDGRQGWLPEIAVERVER
ncbi:MAG TPA: tetratricopeptide repeat protein [Phototrophicaceae bacterium]|nr:tetratricopeptide repeat protein [Phototrophicaceae bacterium]